MKCFTYWLCFVHDQMNYSRNNVLGTWINVFIISHYSRRFWSDFLVLQWILLPFIIEFTLPSLMIHMFVFFKGLHPNHTCRSYTPRFDLFFSTLTHVILYFNFPWTLHKLEREIKVFHLHHTIERQNMVSFTILLWQWYFACKRQILNSVPFCRNLFH